MCDQRNADIVRTVVKEFVQKNWSFTAYTITTEAKNRGADEPHPVLKKVVHKMFTDGEMVNDKGEAYIRNHANIPGLSVQPFLYAPAVGATVAGPVSAQDSQTAAPQAPAPSSSVPDGVVQPD